jgi:hypothetical protein
MRTANAFCLVLAFFILRTQTVEADLSRYSIQFREQLKTPNKESGDDAVRSERMQETRAAPS